MRPKASVKCIRTRGGIKRGNKAQRPEGLICDLQAKTDGEIPQDKCFIAISWEGRAGSDSVKRANVSLYRLIDSIWLNAKLIFLDLLNAPSI